MHFLKGYATPFLRFGISSSSPLEVVADFLFLAVVRANPSFDFQDSLLSMSISIPLSDRDSLPSNLGPACAIDGRFWKKISFEKGSVL